MKQYLEIGKIVNVHGLRGDMKVVPWCDDPEFLCEFDTLYLGKAQKPVTVTAARLQKGNVLLHLEGVDTVEEAEKLRNQVLYMDRDEVELEEGVYFIQDLIGLEVLDVDTGKSYGKLTDVMQTGANDVYEVKDADGKTVLIPAIPDVVQETDLDGGVMRIRPLEACSMQIEIATLFPEMCEAVLSESIIGRARKAGHISVRCWNIRDYTWTSTAVWMMCLTAAAEAWSCSRPHLPLL